jgi:erythromycin esterase-like protein
VQPPQFKTKVPHLLSMALLVVLSTVPPTYHAYPASAQAPSDRYFPETKHSISGQFLQYWEEHGGLAQQGYPISQEMEEKSDTDGKLYTVQYFERAVFELHLENKPPYNVLLSLLGNFQYQRKYPNGAPRSKPSDANGSVFFKETGKRVGSKFLEYWKAHGGLAQQGFPISDEFTEVSELNGKTYTVQYFERAVFELHPENRSTSYEVLLSQLGSFQYARRYPAATPTVTPGGGPSPSPTARSTPAPFGPEVIPWLREHAIPFSTSERVTDYSDLMPLKEIIGGARIVALGEATHGTHEFFTMKHRMLEFLVEEMGFSVFALEDEWAGTESVNDYVQGGAGTAEQAVRRLPGSIPWWTEEMHEMVSWMRAHNEAPGSAPRVSFRGVDMQLANLPLNNVEAYINRVDPPAVQSVGQLYNCFRTYVVIPYNEEYKKLPANERASCRANLQRVYDHVSSRQSVYEAASSHQEFASVLQSARVVLQNEECNSGPACLNRDLSMAENATWLLEQAGPDAKIVIWAHDAHIGTYDEQQSSYLWKSMGQHLRDRYGDQMVVFGFDFSKGLFNAAEVSGNEFVKGWGIQQIAPPHPDSYEYGFDAVDMPRMFLDLRNVTPGDTATNWLLGPRGKWLIGAAYDPHDPYHYNTFLREMSLPSWFDVLVYLRDSSPSRVLK